MDSAPYKRKPGDLEIRVLRDGRVVILAPDETALDLAEAIAPDNATVKKRRQVQDHGEVARRAEPQGGTGAQDGVREDE